MLIARPHPVRMLQTQSGAISEWVADPPYEVAARVGPEVRVQVDDPPDRAARSNGRPGEAAAER